MLEYNLSTYIGLRIRAHVTVPRLASPPRLSSGPVPRSCYWRVRYFSLYIAHLFRTVPSLKFSFYPFCHHLSLSSTTFSLSSQVTVTQQLLTSARLYTPFYLVYIHLSIHTTYHHPKTIAGSKGLGRMRDLRVHNNETYLPYNTTHEVLQHVLVPRVRGLPHRDARVS